MKEYFNVKRGEEVTHVGHITSVKRRYMGESYVDQLIEEANKLCEVGRLDFWRDFGDESRDPDLGGSWYGYDVYLIAPKKNFSHIQQVI